MSRDARESILELVGEIDAEVTSAVEDGDVDGALEKARAALEEYDYEGAHGFYKLALLFSEGDADVACQLATFLIDDYAIFDQAISVLESAACESNATSRRLRARAHYLAGHSQEAMSAFREVISSGDGDAAAHINLGKLLLDAKQPEEAYRTLGANVVRESKDARGEALLEQAATELSRRLAPGLSAAQQSFDAGQFDAALAQLTEVTASPYLPPEYHRLKAQLDRRLAESSLEGHLDRGSELEASGELEAALSEYKAALTVDPGCELAKTRVAEVGHAIEQAAGRNWLHRGNQAAAASNLDEAIYGYYMAVTRDGGLQDTGGGNEALFTLVKEYRHEVGRVPEKGQSAALVALFKAGQELARENLPGASLELGRSGNLAELLPTGRTYARRMQDAEQGERLAQARAELGEARTLDEAGQLDEALAIYERVARVTGFDGAKLAGDRARAIQASRSNQEARGKALASLQGLLAESQYFLALREIDKARTLLAGEATLERLEAEAREGTRTKFPLSLSVVPAVQATRRMPVDGSHDFVPEKSRFLQATPGGKEYLAVAGRTLFVLEPGTLQVKVRAELPPQADLTDKKGFILSDVVPGDRVGMAVVNFEDDLLLYFQYRRNQLELVNVLPVERFLQQSRRKVTRWYTLNGPQEQLVVCQAPQGGGGETRLYGLSLFDGRLEHDDEFGYPLSSLRRIDSPEARYVVHRQPEPMLMRRPGYFSMMFLDARLRVTERLNVGPEDLEGTFIESTRWMRVGERSGNRYFLFRFFDTYSGQLVNRPLAFAALNKSNDVLYAAPDSSILVRNGGDLDAMGELFMHDDKEHLAVLGRKESEPFLFVVDLSRFSLVEKHRLDSDRHYVGLVPTERTGTFSLVSLDKKDGGILMETMEVI